MLSCDALDQIEARGLTVTLAGGKIRLAPAERVDGAVRDLVHAHRDEIISSLKGKYSGPFQESGEAIKVYLPPLDADVWLCSDREAMDRVKHEELACFLYNDLVYIHQGKPRTERLSRLHEVYAMRHPVTRSILDLFHGKIRSIKVKREPL